MYETLEMIQYLLDEIRSEHEYNEKYAVNKREAMRKAEEELGNMYEYWRYLRSPRKSVIKQNAVTIRRLLLKLYKEDN
jgi:hypothetical protein